MAIYTLPNVTSGYDNILLEVIQQVPLITPMFTLFTFVFIFLTGMGMQQNKTGNADVPMWATLGFLSATFLNLIFSLTAGIIEPIVLGVTISLTIFSALWLFMSRGRFE